MHASCVSRHHRKAVVGALALLASTLTMLGVVPVASAGTITTQSYTFTGDEQTFTVPAGVHSLSVVAVGGHGGNSASGLGSPLIAGGEAAEVNGEIAVTPGEVLYVEVAGDGQNESEGGGGGFNGGGEGGPLPYGAGGGGGASDIRSSPRAFGLLPDTRSIVAAGGGGAGGSSYACGSSPPGNDGGIGGAAGQNGGTGPCSNGGGDAGSQTGGGQGTSGGCGGQGEAGGLGYGGRGSSGGCGNDTGGGGGAGLYGGGGGSGGSSASGGGGGGGSSLIPAGGSVRLTSGQPEIEISYALTGPEVATLGATAVEQTSATLNATVNPEGEEVTDCNFEYGTSLAYGHSVPCSPSPGSGSAAVSVSAVVGGLEPNTTYYYRVEATNGIGTTDGTQATLTTPPLPVEVATTPASSVTATAANLNGTVDPRGASVSSCAFEYGPTTSYGSSAPCSPTPGSGSTPEVVSAAIGELEPATTYHFRLVAANAAGTIYGEDETFTTLGGPPTPKLEAGLSWGTPVELSGAPALVSVSCSPGATATAGLCMAISANAAYTASNPTGSYDYTALPNEGANVVCLNTASCISAGSGYVDIGSVSGSVASWESNRNNGGAFNALACGSISFCLHTQEGSEAILWTTTPTSNVSWSQAGNPHFRIHALSCAPNTEPESGLCVAVGASSEIEQSTAPSGGWSAPAAPSGDSGATITSVSCPSNTFCAAVDSAGDLLTTTNPAVGASAWTVRSVDAGQALTAISCAPGTEVCVAVDNSGQALQIEGVTVGQPVEIDAGRDLVSVVCTSTSFCIAADSSGYLVSTSAGTGGGTRGFTAGPGPEEGTLHGTVNPNGQPVASCAFEYGPTMAYGSTVPCETLPGSGRTPVEVQAQIDGLELRPLYHYRLVATNASGESVSTDGTFKLSGGAPAPPSVSTGVASQVTREAATLNATVNPNGEQVTACAFEYGTTAAYGTSVPCAQAPGRGEATVSTSAQLTGLHNNTLYHYRVVATNRSGTSEGSDGTFKTLPYPPTIAALAPSGVTQTAATVGGTVDPNGAEVTACVIEYGATSGYGASLPCSPSPGSGEAPVAVTAALTGLVANHQYDYRVVATNAGGTSYGPNQTFDTLPNPPVVETSSYLGATSTLTGAVIPNDAEVTSCFFEYGNTRLYGHTVPCAEMPGAGEAPVEVAAPTVGLVAGQTYHFRLVASNAGGTGDGADETFVAQAGPPLATTGVASAITQTAATLSATVNPNGSEVTECELEYGPTAGYGSSAPCSTLPGGGTSAVETSAAIAGLAANTTYHFRVVARNASRVAYGTDQTFKTLPDPPAVFTGSASSVTASSAVIEGEVDPEGAEVGECVVEYGPTTAYGSVAPCSLLPGAGISPVPVSAILTGLSSSLQYHYRLLAVSAGGSGSGVDQVFTTMPPGQAPTITGLSTKKGPAAGGTTVTITGTGFAGASAVKFGGFSAQSFTVSSPTEIVAVTAPGTSGALEVTVSTPDGTSGRTPKAKFTYGKPTVSSVSPNSGPLVGGTLVTVEGSGFAIGNTTGFLFAKASGDGVKCSSTMSCTVTTPVATKAGPVDVIAVVGKAKSKKARPGDLFTFE